MTLRRGAPVWVHLLQTRGREWVEQRLERLQKEAERRRLHLPPEPAADDSEGEGDLDFADFRATE